jgi:hypothetical protein
MAFRRRSILSDQTLVDVVAGRAASGAAAVLFKDRVSPIGIAPAQRRVLRRLEAIGVAR